MYESLKTDWDGVPYEALVELVKNEPKNPGEALGTVGKRLRVECQTNLYFLTWKVLQRDLVWNTHALFCDFFVKKSAPPPGVLWVKHFAELDTVKSRLLLAPRGSYKSTCGIADAVQWILCFPNIRIAFMSGDFDLAQGFLTDLQSYFILGDEPTLFQMLFSEHCISAADKYENKFTTPARTEWFKEPTVKPISLEASLSGRHYDVIQLGDAVTNKNSGSTESLAKIRKNFYINRKMLMTYGYVNADGTRYDDSDLWGHMIEQAEEYNKKTGDISLKLICEPAYRVKPESLGKPEEDLVESDVVLFFPQILDWRTLMLEKHNDPESFWSQLMNRPLSRKKVRATEDLIRAHTVPWEQLPIVSKIYIQWDLSYSVRNKRDFCIAAVMAVDEMGRGFIIDVVKDHYATGRDLAFKIVDLIRQYRPELTRIEDSVGGQWLKSDIDFWAWQMVIKPRIEWVPVDNAKDAKESRIRVVVGGLIPADKLWFSSAISDYDELLDEFTKFNCRDDIPDAIGLLVDVLPLRPAEVSKQTREQFQKEWDALRDKAHYEMVYQVGQYAPPETPVIKEEPEQEGIQVVDYFGFPKKVE